MKSFIRFCPAENSSSTFGSGFFSNYRTILDQLISNDECMDAKPYIDWSKTVWVDGFNPFEDISPPKIYNPFDFWFDQEIPLEFDLIRKPKILSLHTKVKHYLDYFNDEVNLQKQRQIEKKYLKLKKSLVDKVDEIFDAEFKGNTVLGVIARGCEFSHYHPEYGIVSIQDYVKAIQVILNSNRQINKLFFVSEDSNYIEVLKKNFSNFYYMPDVFRRTDENLEYMKRVYLWPNVNNKRENHNKLLGEEMILQTKLLGKCDYLLGIHSGIFAGAVLWGENIKNIYKLK